jgi:hypothetical protein
LASVKSICLTILLALLMTVQIIGQAQVDSTLRQPWFWSVSAPNFGFIVPHTKQMTHLIQGHSLGFHTYLFKKLHTHAWHHAYNHPEHGIDVTYIYTGNPQQLGHQLALSYLLNLPLHRKKIGLSKNDDRKPFHNWLGLGLGTGYSSKTWDLRDNHQAAVIGSHLNIALTLQYSVRAIQFKHAEIRSGLRITHFSNGAFQIPNLGTNNLGLFVSYVPLSRESNEKRLYKHNLDMLEISVPEYQRGFRYSLFAGVGLKEIQPPTRKKYPAYTLSALIENRLTYKSSLGLGADLFNNTSLKTIQQRLSNTTVIGSDVVQVGIAISYSLHLRDFELKMQQGIYLHDRFNLDGKFYNRFGLRYRMNNHWFAQLTLKTHFAKADYGEWGFGYAF